MCESVINALLRDICNDYIEDSDDVLIFRIHFKKKCVMPRNNQNMRKTWRISFKHYRYNFFEDISILDLIFYLFFILYLY